MELCLSLLTGSCACRKADRLLCQGCRTCSARVRKSNRVAVGKRIPAVVKLSNLLRQLEALLSWGPRACKGCRAAQLCRRLVAAATDDE
ncbi:hypothetical protein GUJ93_ZPchr0008g13212 [Zizania palustris]|uniref:Uncharacterized protein n=1 Tax=Zizania palustris TaxID=103762 RepID=A0A8J5R6L0_ZIZPA|nr:hypothetical protein GUJ93_ZPchr0008g13212 [Zizania palustris]